MAKVKKKSLQPGIVRVGEMPGELRQTTFVRALAISGDGRFVVTGDDKGAVRLFDTINGECWERRSPAAIRRRREVERIAISADGATIAVRYYDWIWILDTKAFDTAPGTLVPDVGQFGLTFSPDGRALAGSHVWGITLVDTATGMRRPLPTGDGAAAYGIEFSPDGALVAGAYVIRGGVQRLRLLDTVTGAIRAEADVTDQDDLTRSALAIRQDGSIVVATEKLTILEWDGGSAGIHRRPLKIPDADTHWPTPRLFLPLNALAVRFHDSTALVDLSSGNTSHEMTGRDRHLAVTPDGRTLASADGVTVDLHEGATLELRTPEAKLSTFVTAVAFEADGDALWTADETSVRRWTLPDAAPDVVLRTDGIVRRLTPDGTAALVSASSSGRVVSLPSGEALGEPFGSVQHIPGLSPDGTLVAGVGATNAGVRLWDATTGLIARDLQPAGGYPYAMAFSRSGRLVAAGFGHSEIHVWEAATGTIVAQFTGPGKPALALDISPDESMLAIGGDERTVWIVSLPAGRLVHALVGHTRREVWAVAFSPNGALLASSNRRDVRLWDTRNGTAAGVARVGANALAFSHDGSSLAAGGDGAAWVIEISH